MALQHLNNNYTRIPKQAIIDMINRPVPFETFETQAKSTTALGEFERKKEDHVRAGAFLAELNKNAYNQESILDNVISAMYRALKVENQFKDCTDV